MKKPSLKFLISIAAITVISIGVSGALTAPRYKIAANAPAYDYSKLQKEKLGRQGRQVLYALLPERRADRTLEILRLSSRTFSSFLSGQCLEACILGGMFFVTMTLLGMPYVLLISVFIAVTALIPAILVFLYGQTYLEQGIIAAGVKE